MSSQSSDELDLIDFGKHKVVLGKCLFREKVEELLGRISRPSKLISL